jgi:hypothetical protein
MPMHELQPIESPNPWIAPAALRELQRLEAHLEPLRRRLLEADVYASVADMDALRRLTEHHVFAVWDFMSLVKRLQGELTCMQQPWRPVGDPELRRTITEIVLEEECDRDPQGNAISHFELYLEAMRRLGANPSAAKRLTNIRRRPRRPSPSDARRSSRTCSGASSSGWATSPEIRRLGCASTWTATWSWTATPTARRPSASSRTCAGTIRKPGAWPAGRPSAR